MVYVGHTPDEMRHISYIAYLEETGKIIPDFSHMEFMTDTNPASFVPGSINQLGHPPLVLSCDETVCAPIDNLGNGEYYIHTLRLRVFSAFFGLLADGSRILYRLPQDQQESAGAAPVIYGHDR